MPHNTVPVQARRIANSEAGDERWRTSSVSTTLVDLESSYIFVEQVGLGEIALSHNIGSGELFLTRSGIPY